MKALANPGAQRISRPKNWPKTDLFSRNITNPKIRPKGVSNGLQAVLILNRISIYIETKKTLGVVRRQSGNLHWPGTDVEIWLNVNTDAYSSAIAF